MQSVNAIEHDTGRTGAGQRRGNLLTDIARLADAKDDNLAPARQRFGNGCDRARKSVVELRADSAQRGQLHVEYLSGSSQMIHAREVAKGAGQLAIAKQSRMGVTRAIRKVWALCELVLSLVSLHASLQRAFNRSVNMLAARNKPLFRVVAVVAVFVDGETPALFPSAVLQPANWSDAAEVLSVQVEVLAFEPCDVPVASLGFF